jgi:hypothetical protein
MLNDLQSGLVICTAGAIPLVSARSYGDVCTLANAGR